MTRARAIRLAAAVVVLAVAGYLLRRASRKPVPAALTPPPSAPATLRTEPIVATTEEFPINEPLLPEEAAHVGTDSPTGVDQGEQPLPTWVRVAIVAAALLAFFAVSLIATKQV